MQQVVQNTRTGEVSVTTIPDPIVRPGQVLIADPHPTCHTATVRKTLQMATRAWTALATKALQRGRYPIDAASRLRMFVVPIPCSSI